MFAFADDDASDNDDDHDEVLDVDNVEVGKKRLASSAFNFQAEEEEEEDEEIIPQQIVKEQSIDYVDARQAIDEDPWDCTSWMKIIEEAKAHRSGNLTVLEACELFLKQFPKADHIWYLYCETLLNERQETKAEEVLKKSARSCRSVALWRLYLQYTKGLLDKISHHHDSYQAERRNVENIFEQAVDSVGLCLDSSPLWRMYIDFVRDAYDLKAEDPGKKLALLRRIYQRCICIPNDSMEEYFKEYVTLEKSKSEELAEQLLADYSPKHSAARVIYREKKRLLSKIDQNKLARVPGGPNPVQEIEQLEAWGRYIRYDRNLEDSILMDPVMHKSLMELSFERCLCHFRHYPEVWLAYARYIWECLKDSPTTPTGASSVLTIRSIYREAISIIPYCALLRIAWSELEEQYGNVEIARDILKQCYEQVPGALSFSVLQRFVRKKDGKSAARKCFSETLPLRAEGKVGVGVYFCHAELELNVNCDPKTALNILTLAVEGHKAALTTAAAIAGTGSNDGASAAPTSLSTATGLGLGLGPGGIECDITYVRLMSRILLQLGDIDRLRYVFHVALDALSNSMQQGHGQGQGQGRAGGGKGALSGGDSVTEPTSISSADGSASGSGSVVVLGSNLPTVSLTLNSERAMRTQWTLWEEFHCLENTFGCSDLLRLNRIRESRNAARNAYMERYGGSAAASAASAEAAMDPSTQIGGHIRYMGYNVTNSQLDVQLQQNNSDRSFSIFTPTALLFERYDNLSFSLVTAPPVSPRAIVLGGGGNIESSPAHADYFLKLRGRGPAYLDELMRREEERLSAAAGMAGMAGMSQMTGAAGRSRGGGVGSGGMGQMGGGRQSAEEIVAADEAMGVPPLLRELLNKLPPGPLPMGAVISPVEIDGFVDQLRRVVLPPRPYSDITTDDNNMSGRGMAPPPPLPLPPSGMPGNGVFVGGGISGDMEVDNDEDEDRDGTGTASLAGAPQIQYAEGLQPTVDIFQQRQRARLGLDR